MRCTHQSHVGTNESSTLSRYPKPSLCHSQRRGTSGSPHNFRETLRNHLRGGGRTPRRALPPGKTGTQSGRRSLLITPGLKARRQECQAPEADTVSPRGTMNPDFPSPMPPMAGDAEQLGKEEQRDQVLNRPECLPAFRVPRH